METYSGKIDTARFIEEEGEEKEEMEILKRRISCHPLYGLLIETHLDCLKVGFGEIEEVGSSELNQDNKTSKVMKMSPTNQSDLDDFMEAYFMALSKLKEGIRESVLETTAFVNGMQFQLKELMTTHPTTHSTPTSTRN